MFKKLILVAGGFLAGAYVACSEVHKKLSQAVIDNYREKQESVQKNETKEEPKKTPSRKKKTNEVPETTEEEP